VQRKVRAALGRAASGGTVAYSLAFRALVGQPGWESLLGAIIAFDHDWFLAELNDLLGTDPVQAANQLWWGVVDLNRAEADALKDELRQLEPRLGRAYVDALERCIDGEAQSGTYNGRTGPIRWAKLRLVP
jgi:hypothetical protein